MTIWEDLQQKAAAKGLNLEVGLGTAGQMEWDAEISMTVVDGGEIVFTLGETSLDERAVMVCVAAYLEEYQGHGSRYD